MQDVAEKDILARFILERRRFSPTNSTVNFRAFLPNPRLELSVFLITNWPEDKIWQVGQRYVAGPQEKPLKARGDVEVSVILENDLTIEMDNNPAGHANVLG